MDDKEQLYKQLEDYLDGKLSASEIESLEHMIATNESVAEQYTMLRLERELGSLMVDDKLDAKMAEWSKESGNPVVDDEIASVSDASTTKTFRKVWLLLLLVGVILLLIYFLQSSDSNNQSSTRETAPNTETTETEQDAQEPPVSIPENTNTNLPSGEIEQNENQSQKPQKAPSNPPIAQQPAVSSQQLALALADTRPLGEISTRTNPGVNAANESSFDKGYRYLGEQKPDSARLAFLSVADSEMGQYLNAQQYASYILFEQAAYKDAIPILEMLIEEEYADKPKMQWLLALSYLATGEEKKGMSILKVLAASEESGVYKEKARSLIDR